MVFLWLGEDPEPRVVKVPSSIVLVCFVSGQTGTTLSPTVPLFCKSTTLPPRCLSPTVYQLVKLNAECFWLAQSPRSPARWLSPWQQAHLELLMEAVVLQALPGHRKQGPAWSSELCCAVVTTSADRVKWPNTPCCTTESSSGYKYTSYECDFDIVALALQVLKTLFP